MQEVVVLYTVVEALPGNENYPEGEYYAANLFVRSLNREEAVDVAARELEARHLVLVSVESTGLVSPERIEALDATARDSYRAALRSGFSALIYDQPIPRQEIERTKAEEH